jgi:hypothetical protein
MGLAFNEVISQYNYQSCCKSSRRHERRTSFRSIKRALAYWHSDTPASIGTAVRLPPVVDKYRFASPQQYAAETGGSGASPFRMRNGLPVASMAIYVGMAVRTATSQNPKISV